MIANVRLSRLILVGLLAVIGAPNRHCRVRRPPYRNWRLPGRAWL